MNYLKQGENMRALLVIDLQKGIVKQKDFSEEINNIKLLINHFKLNNLPIIFTKHLDEEPESILYKNSDGVEIIDIFEEYSNYIIEKSTPDSFFNTELEKILRNENVTELVICGFNTEYCCLFTSIVAFDKKFKVYFIEDATGTVCDENTYEMPGLDIKDFIGSILNWSNVINVLYLDEYKEEFF